MSPTTRVPRSTWVAEGLRELATGGPDAVRIEPLAQRLGVTRGSFYWHFADRGAFLEALLDAWERRSTDEVLARVERDGGDHREKVRRAGMLTFSREMLPLDLAVRYWARRDTTVAERLRRVDNRRMGYLRELIGAFVSDPDEVEARSMLAFTLLIGGHFVAADHEGRSRGAVLDRAAQVILAEGGTPAEP